MRAQHCREDRPGVRHQRDGPGRDRVALEEADRPDTPCRVDETHAAAPADLQAFGGVDQLVAEAVGAAEYDRAGVAPGGSEPDLLDQRRVRDAEQDQVHGFGQVGERREAGLAQHRRTAGVHEEDLVRRGCAEPRWSSASRTSRAGRSRRRPRPSGPRASAQPRTDEGVTAGGPFSWWSLPSPVVCVPLS